MYESEVVKNLVARENLVAQKEFHLDGVGFVDILTKDQIIEVKEVGSWKHALGQVLAYSAALGGNREKRIHLFSRSGEIIDKNDVEVAKRICQRFGVTATWEGADYVRRAHAMDRRLASLDRFRFGAR